MKISVMREFVILAQNENFTRTAEELYIAQSALSRHMNALEEELGVRLIERSHNSFRLTPAGEITRDEFTKILNHYDRLLERIAEPDMEKGELRVGFLYYDRDLYVARIHSEFHDQFPNIRLKMASCQPHDLEDRLLSGKIDAAFLYGAVGSDRGDIEVLPFLKVPFSLIYTPDHRFASMDKVSVEDLDGEDCIFPEKPLEINGSARELKKMMKDHHISFSSRIPVSNFDEVPWIMAETGAIYLSPMANPGAYGDETQYRYLAPDDYSVDISVVWLKENTNPAIHRLLSVVRRCFP